jgi:hypothetical protein
MHEDRALNASAYKYLAASKPSDVDLISCPAICHPILVTRWTEFQSRTPSTSLLAIIEQFKSKTTDKARKICEFIDAEAQVTLNPMNFA